ncbi:MAG TPA: 1-phosphofructokinase [Thermoanaerobaculia bacterium]|jgi:1-phosphofructokinase|nr:1-phosphofructokinase [Thermoanaerobaculia bacterium]
MRFEPAVVTVTLNPAIDQTLAIPGFAAGRVNRVAASRSDAGGKGVNVACFLADLGIAVAVTGFLGMENQRPFETLFEEKGIADRFVSLAGPTRVGIKIVDEESGETTDINFPGLAPGREEIADLSKRIADLAGPGRWFVLAGSVPAGVVDDVYARLIELIHAEGGRVVLDTSGRPLRAALASRPEVMKPNLEELGELVGRTLDSPGAVRDAGRSLLAQGVERVVISMGAEGAVFVDREQALLARPPRLPVKSTVGAGDAMVAGIVYALLRGLPLAELARMATASGAYAVTRIGSGMADRAELEKWLGEIEIEVL